MHHGPPQKKVHVGRVLAISDSPWARYTADSIIKLDENTLLGLRRHYCDDLSRLVISRDSVDRTQGQHKNNTTR